MLSSEKLKRRLLFGANSTRPSLPILTVALLFSAVVIMLSENSVPPEIALWPLTVTFPATESSPAAFAPGDAKTTIE
jgi:hypothetical protein